MLKNNSHVIKAYSSDSLAIDTTIYSLGKTLPLEIIQKAKPLA